MFICTRVAILDQRYIVYLFILRNKQLVFMIDILINTGLVVERIRYYGSMKFS